MFKINGVVWRIILVSPNHPFLYRSDGSLSIAACDYNYKAIFISDQINVSFVKKVLCHEITHAAMFSYDIDLDLAQEEVLADLIATYGQEIVCLANKMFETIKKRRVF